MKTYLSLQWHITTKCSNHCKHCYMYDEKTFENERKNTLSLKGLIQTLDNLQAFEKKYNVEFLNFTITGGDPLLRDDVFDFFDELKKRKKNFSILGNPETLNKKVIEKLKKYDLNNFQLSLDGLEKTHDSFRGPGRFKNTIEKAALLNDNNISNNFMFTLFPSNAKELIPLMNFIAKNTKTSFFCFDIGTLAGCAKNLNANFSPSELKKILNDFLKEKDKLEKEYDIIFGEKSNFHKIVRFEKDLLFPVASNSTPVKSGCLIGWNPPSLLSDGTMLACRRLPIPIGNITKTSFEDIFLKNSLLKKFRRRAFFKGCKNCDLYSSCRGCPASGYGLTEDPFEKHPMCFRDAINKDQIKNSCSYLEPDLNTTPKEEWEYIKSHHLFKESFIDFLKKEDFQFIYLDLASDKKLRNEFLKSPKTYIENKKYKLTVDELSYLMHRFSEKIYHNRYEMQSDPIAKKATENMFKNIFST